MAVLHMVIWQLQGDSAAARHADALRMSQAFEALVGEVPGLLRPHAGPNAVSAPDAWDLGVALIFDNHASLAAYNQHPSHLAIKQHMGPLRRNRAMVGIDFTDTPT